VRTVHPGDTFTDTLSATNLTGKPLSVILDAVDAGVTADGQFAPASRGVRAATGHWISLSRSTLTLPPHGSVAVPARFRVPADATDGDHLAAVTIQRRDVDSVRNGIAVQVRVAVRVYLTVVGGGRGTAPAAFTIRDLSFTGTSQEPRLAVTVAATGSRLVETAGRLRLSRGSLSDTLDLPVLGAVPAGESRSFTIPLRAALEPGRYVAALDLWLPDGSVKASARTEFGVDTAADRQWGLREALVASAIFLVLLFLLPFLWRRRRRQVTAGTGRGAHRAQPTVAR
jgi:hypothetical protein